MANVTIDKEANKAVEVQSGEKTITIKLDTKDLENTMLKEAEHKKSTAEKNEDS